MDEPFKEPGFVFLQPKAELDASPPIQSNKPKFQPKAKPRPQARTKPPKAPPHHPAQVKQENSTPSPHEPPVLDAEIDGLPTPKRESHLDIKPKLEPVVIDRLSGHSGVAVKSEEEFGPKHEDAEQPDSPPGSPSIGVNEDTIVREIDVYLCPTIDPDTQLYLLQYPLRPHWRPYGLELCDSVRVKPKQSKLEFDLVLDTDEEHYDHDAAEHLLIKKQTLSSSRTAQMTNYAVGLLCGNKLHLNPLHAIVQLRPSLKYLDDADAKKKQAKQNVDDMDEEMVDADEEGEEDGPEVKSQLVALKVEVKKQETERQEQMRLQSHAYLKQLDEAEAWVQLEPHGVGSPVTDGIRHMMASTEGGDVPFGMPMSHYINYLLPGRANSNSFEAAAQDMNGDEGLSRSFLDTLPLEQRFEKLLSKGRVHVLQFERLMKLAPSGCTEQEVLSVLQDMAHLVQGCWVAASALRCSGHICIVRDYILSLFTKNRVILHHQLEDLHVPREMIREVLLPLAVQRPAAGGWEFQESTDRSFIKRHHAVVKEQLQKWTENEDKIKDAALSLRIGIVASSSSSASVHRNQSTSAPIHKDLRAKSSSHKAVSGGKSTNIAEIRHGKIKNAEHEAFSGEWTMSEETRAALPIALREIFMKHNVCSLQFICQSLRELAITKAAAPNANSRVVAAAVAAAKGASAPLSELTAAIGQVASNIDGIYFLTSLGNPILDPFRDVVVALLRAKGANTGLRRLDIIEASKIALKAEVQATVYQKVLKELCYTKGGAWVLKPGDGRPM